MLFIMLNHVYPFDRKDKAKMIENQMKRNFRLRVDVEERVSTEAKHLIGLLLEPDPSKRLSLKDVCAHVWFPIIHTETELLVKPVTPTATPTSTSNK